MLSLFGKHIFLRTGEDCTHAQGLDKGVTTHIWMDPIFCGNVIDLWLKALCKLVVQLECEVLHRERDVNLQDRQDNLDS